MRRGLTSCSLGIAVTVSVLTASLLVPPPIHQHANASPTATAGMPVLAAHGPQGVDAPLCPACAAGRAPAATMPVVKPIGVFCLSTVGGWVARSPQEILLPDICRARAPPATSAA